MKITFTTKEESKLTEEKAFLALSGAQRFEEFLKLCYELKDFPSDDFEGDNGNFVIELGKIV